MKRKPNRMSARIITALKLIFKINNTLKLIISIHSGYYKSYFLSSGGTYESKAWVAGRIASIGLFRLDCHLASGHRLDWVGLSSYNVNYLNLIKI